MAEIKIPVSLMGEPTEILAQYRKLVKSGVAPRMAEILATRHFPGAWTDCSRMAATPTLEDGCGKYYADKVKGEARRAGIVVSDNSRYNPTMADTRGGGDPKAWTHAGDGLSTLKQRLIERGGGSEDLGVQNDMARVEERMAKKKAIVEKNRSEKAARRQERMEKLAKQK